MSLALSALCSLLSPQLRHCCLSYQESVAGWSGSAVVECQHQPAVLADRQQSDHLASASAARRLTATESNLLWTLTVAEL